MEPSEAARRLKALRERAGLPMRAVSESLGWTLTRYQHYEDRYRRPYLPLEFVRRLADIFAQRGVDPGEVMSLAGVGPGGLTSLPSAPPPLVGNGAHPIGGRDLPIMGAVRGGAEGFFFNDGEPKEYLRRPPFLEGAANAFALYVDGDSMEPRYFAGEILYVNPNRPVTRNCFVAVELADGQGLIKQFLRRDDTLVVLRQFNPGKEIRIQTDQVRHIYRITGAGEAG
ncbi:MAG: S24 family peptidase [Dongiaceae bacterium]